MKPEMKALASIAKTQDYLDYVKEHIENVGKAWEEVQEKCKDMRFVYDDYAFWSLNSEVENHDMSKLSEHEFVQYRKAFYATTAEDEARGDEKYDWSGAWGHHKDNNPHHWENWVAADEEGYYNPYEAEMNCAHMVIDWIAIGYKFGDTAEAYYTKNKDRIKLPEWAVTFIGEIFSRLALVSED